MNNFTEDPSNVNALLDYLESLGVTLCCVGSDIRYSAPKGTVSPDIIRRISDNKPALLDCLRMRSLQSCLVHFKRVQCPGYTVVCVHTGHGGVMQYQHLTQQFGADVAIVGLHALNYIVGSQRVTTIAEMASRYVGELHRALGNTRVVLYGASSGGLIALEMACQLSDAGSAPMLLVLGDTLDANKHLREKQALVDRYLWINFSEIYLEESTKLITDKAHEFWHMDVEQRLEFIWEKANHSRIRHLATERSAIWKHYFAYCKYFDAYISYVPREYFGESMYVYVSTHKPETSCVVRSQLQGRTDERRVTGRHFDIVQEDQMKRVGAYINDALNTLRG